MNDFPVLAKASDESRRALAEIGKWQSIQKEEILFRERERVDEVYFVADGFVALYRVMHTHDYKAVFVCAKGDMLNEVVLDEPVASVSCRALSPEVKLLAIDRNAFLDIMENDCGLRRAVFSSLSKKLRRTYHQLGNSGNSLRLDRQVAAKMYKLGRDFGEMRQGEDGLWIGFPLSITFLAELVGSKRETVSRVVKKLADMGFVRTDQGGFWIADLERLKEYVHHRK